MSDNTKIEWAKATWNPVTGCSPISEGCLNCYAKRMAKRLAGRYGYPKDDPFKVTIHWDKLNTSFGKKPKRIFVCSMGDFAHEDVPFHAYRHLFFTMFRQRQHTFLILTKRPNRLLEIIGRVAMYYYPNNWPFPNVFCGVTVELQKYDWRIVELLKTPAAVRFVSVEPCIGPIDFLQNGYLADHEWEKGVPGGINWVICGAETGPGARYMDPGWARNLRDQTRAANIPFFMKAMSGKEPIPSDLQIREYPQED